MNWIIVAVCLGVVSVLTPIFMMCRCIVGRAGGPEDHPKTVAFSWICMILGAFAGFYWIFTRG